MKTLNAISITLLIVFLAPATQAQTITLTATNGQPSTYNFSTNQIITVNSFISTTGSPYGENYAHLSFYDGRKISIAAYGFGLNQVWDSTGSGLLSMAFAPGGAVFTGVTNILVTTGLTFEVIALTLTITTPTVQSLIPANAVVIPSDATGPVQIVLESSSDLINWTSSLPGTYGNTYSNRFFRVRAIAQ